MFLYSINNNIPANSPDTLDKRQIHNYRQAVTHKPTVYPVNRPYNQPLYRPLKPHTPNLYYPQRNIRPAGINRYNPYDAHKHTVCPRQDKTVIFIDDNPDLGLKPYLVINNSDTTRQMEKVNGGYSVRLYHTDSFNYHIKYMDTGKIDTKGKNGYLCNTPDYIKKALIKTRAQYQKPMITAIKEGKTIGKISFDVEQILSDPKNAKEIKEPTILVGNIGVRLNSPNIVGLILTSDCSDGIFSHYSTQLRQAFDICGVVRDENKINELKSLQGQRVELELKDDLLNIKPTDEIGKPMNTKSIDVPTLQSSYKILTSKEYSADIIGAKAVNLRRLEELKEQGKIDVIIPKSIALPSGFLEPFIDDYDNPERMRYGQRRDTAIENGTMDNIINALKENGIDTPEIMVRSSFNGEDLPNYSAAGIYKSTLTNLKPIHLFDAIYHVANSKFYDDAIYSREIHNIPERNIQPGVILQNMIEPDYKYTLYTDDKKGNLKIELHNLNKTCFPNLTDPHVFTYDKKTGELKYESFQMMAPQVSFDEDGEMMELEPLEDDLSGNEKLFDQLRKVAQNALVVEKEFGHPQDIEGGIKGNDIYFWQSRNIVF